MKIIGILQSVKYLWSGPSRFALHFQINEVYSLKELLVILIPSVRNKET